MDELIKQLRDCSEMRSLSLYKRDLMKQAADAIEELSKKYLASEVDNTNLTGGLAEEHAKHLWIPVTERLPEKRKWVLCRCEANIHEVLRWENNEWYHDPLHVYFPSFVTHWMPLPEPPNIMYYPQVDGITPQVIRPQKGENKDPCADCRFYPPSSLDGKPCCACDPSDPFMNCHDAKDGEA